MQVFLMLQLWHRDRVSASRGLEAPPAESRYSALPLRAAPRALPGQPHTATMAQLSSHLQVHPACKRNALAEACAASVAVNVVVMTIHSVWFTEQVVFTSLYKVKPPALILLKNKTMEEVHNSEGLVQIFAK